MFLVLCEHRLGFFQRLVGLLALGLIVLDLLVDLVAFRFEFVEPRVEVLFLFGLDLLIDGLQRAAGVL